MLAPTVTGVQVVATNPDNDAIPFTTGTTTVVITGTEFATVACLTGVALDDTDLGGVLVATHPTSCTVASGTQITAEVPAGSRTNGATGWTVHVTNTAATSATGAAFVPRAGLLASEVYTGTSGSTDHEFVEVYNPTATALDPALVRLHVRSTGGGDTNKMLTAVTPNQIPAHGFLLIAPSASTAADAWFAHRDLTYSAALVANAGVDVSLASATTSKVLDVVGWGAQPGPGFEGTAATANLVSNQSVERRPAGGLGHATDSDDNSVDLTAPSTTITPRGTADAAQP